ncbi:M48 family metallopeptidase, partial [candidate division WWE3 bacterium]|nr:M48 family metallopeptidase [candidate division WWE3 bacterium]
FQLVQNLTIATGMPMPKIYIIESPALNAFATGRDPKHAAIAVTRGLLQRLEKRELEGVLAHELSHIKNFDTRLMTIIVVLVGMVALLTDFAWRASLFGDRDRENRGNGVFAIIGVVLIVLAPIIANIIKLAVSRQREYLADASAAYITRYPQGLIDALTKIASDHQPLETANTATAHLFISNPLKDRKQKLAGLFSTHPPVEERIARLRAM